MMRGERVMLRGKIPADAALDYAWQTDAELARLDACPVISMSFDEYSREYARTIRDPSPRRRMYAVETPQGRHIGNCVYHETEAGADATEIGIMIGEKDCWDLGYGRDAVCALVAHIFTERDFNRIVLKTLAWNRRALRCFNGCGFTEYRRYPVDGYDFVFMELPRRTWEASHEPAA